MHKAAFPMELEDVITTAVMTIGLGMYSAGGIGGGSVLTPLFILLAKFKPKDAIALGNFAILMDYAVSFLKNLKERHPQRPTHKLAIDYNLVLILMPATLYGTTVGVFITSTFPDVSMLILMTLFFLIHGILVLRKGVLQCKQERKEKKSNRK